MQSNSKLNNLFATSRFVLPEHREGYLEMMRDTRLAPRPILEEDELTEIHYRVISARQYNREVTVRWWHPVKNGLGELRELGGRVKVLDPISRRVKVGNAEESVWVDVDNIVEVNPK